MPGSLECGFLVLASTQTSLLLSGCSTECRHCCLLCQVNKLCWWHFLYTDVLKFVTFMTCCNTSFEQNIVIVRLSIQQLPLSYSSHLICFQRHFRDRIVRCHQVCDHCFFSVRYLQPSSWKTKPFGKRKMVVVFNGGAGTQCDTEHSLALIHQWHVTVLYSLITHTPV